ncbi:hypothetical protein EUX98_g3560 [Antrodiella citrinella]|uniref:Uncharacterized protein n=1 Tax=Antrodiella citrinella TaxID=2447956 RepID=A0A4S4MZ16_9APHY|nr:hypothetical protein EUX98_g3560 [Antrodiella citrinella]
MLMQIGGTQFGEMGNPLDFILREKLDDNETMMMDVPQLPPPTEHLPNPLLPLMLTDLIETKPGEQTCPTFNICRALKEVKGSQSLNIELSWRPFNFCYRVPTHEEVAGIDSTTTDSLRATLLSEVQDIEHLSPLLTEALGETGEDVQVLSSSSAQGWYEPAITIDYTCFYDFDDEYVLTEQERRRLHNYPPREHHLYELETCFPQGQEPIEDYRRSSSPKRLKLNNPGPDIVFTVPQSEDSGVFLTVPPEAEEQRNTSRFSQIADEAEGFPGPSQDGELFPDMDPIHFMHPDSPTHATVRHVSQAKDTEHEPFLSLSYDSTQRQLETNRYTQEDIPNHIIPTGSRPDNFERDQSSIPLASPLQHLLVPPGRQSLATFLELRAKKLSFTIEPALVSEVADDPVVPDLDRDLPSIPEELMDRNTLGSPSELPDQRHSHRYMAAMCIIEKRALVRSLALPHNAVALVEREDLGVALTSRAEELVETIGLISWRFPNVLIVFEAFPTSSYYQKDQVTSRVGVNAFSPPVVKAVHKFRRDLSLAEAYLTKCPETSVKYAFALSVDEVARYIRTFGDIAESEDTTNGAIWGDRVWLTDEQENERDLAHVDGMNACVASIILSQTTLEDFLDRSPEERNHEIGPLVGNARMMNFNRTLSLREEMMQLPSSSPPTVTTTTSGGDVQSHSLDAMDSTYL